MKVFLALIAVAVCGLSGYVLEPVLRPWFIAKPMAPRQDRKAPVPAAVEMPVVPAAPAAAALIDPAKLTPEQLPEKVVLKVDIKVSAPGADPMVMPTGSRVKPLRVEGDQLVVSPGAGPFEGKVAISGTDLMEQLAANPPKPAPPSQPADVPATTPTPAPVPAATEPAPATPAPAATEPAPATPAPAATEPAPAAPAPGGNTAAPAGEANSAGSASNGGISPRGESEPLGDSMALAAPAQPAAPGSAQSDVVRLMQEHVRAGSLKEFKYPQVVSWKDGGEETVSGQKYKIGLVVYQADTIFGTKQIPAKALVQDNRVVKWVLQASGNEIK